MTVYSSEQDVVLTAGWWMVVEQDQRPGPPMGQYGSAGLTSWCPRVTASLVSGQCVEPGQESRTAGGERRGGGPGRLTAGPALVAQDGSVGDSQQ